MIPCNFRRHTDAMCILAKLQLEWSGNWWLALMRAWSRLSWSALQTSTLYCSPIRSGSWPSTQTLSEPSGIGRSVSVARRPCWWTVATWACWPAPLLCCSLRPSLQSWVVWVPYSRAWSAVKATIRRHSPHCPAHHGTHNVGDAYRCLVPAAAAAGPPPWTSPISALPCLEVALGEAENTAGPAGWLFHLCGHAYVAGDDGFGIRSGARLRVPGLLPVLEPQQQLGSMCTKLDGMPAASHCPGHTGAAQ